MPDRVVGEGQPEASAASRGRARALRRVTAMRYSLVPVGGATDQRPSRRFFHRLTSSAALDATTKFLQPLADSLSKEGATLRVTYRN